jgi:hypothetical protein
MKPYKGFLIQYKSWEYEEKEWSGGHSSEGTGRYITSSGYDVVDPTTGKSTSGFFNSETDAKLWIDAHRKGKWKKLETKLRAKQEKLQAKIDKLNSKLKACRHTLEQQIRNLENQKSDLYKQLPSRFL